METTERIETVPVEAATPFLQWTAVVAGAFVAAAVSVILIAFGAAIGFSIVSSSPTWRDASPALAVASGLYLLLTALVSFGFGGYMAGRLRERWTTSAHSDVVEFRDGTHGLLAWALAVLIAGLVVAASAANIASKSVQPATSPEATTGEPLIAYELDRLFRAERRPLDGDLTYSRAEAGRIGKAPSRSTSRRRSPGRWSGAGVAGTEPGSFPSTAIRRGGGRPPGSEAIREQENGEWQMGYG